MRFKEFKLVEATVSNFYTVGDSHARGVGTAMGLSGQFNLAVDGAAAHGKGQTSAAMLSNISKIPKGANVLVSVGANDTAGAVQATVSSGGKTKLPSANTIVTDVMKVVNAVKAQDPANIVFLLFPSGENKKTQFDTGDFQKEVRDALRGSVGVKVIDYNGSPMQQDGIHYQMSVYKKAGNDASKTFGVTPSLGNAAADPKLVPVKAATDAGKPDLNLAPGGMFKGNAPSDAAGANTVDLSVGPGKKYYDPAGFPKGPLADKTDTEKDAQADTTEFAVGVPPSDQSPEIADAQKVLLALGYTLPNHGVDGIRGTETTAAIKKFQTDNGIPDTGTVDKATVDKMNAVIAAKPEIKKDLKKSTAADVKGRRSAKTLPPLQTDAVTSGRVGKVLNFIAQFESGGDYNIIVTNKRIPDLTNATISSVYKLQDKMIAQKYPSSAVGRYQYTKPTLKDMVAKMGIDPTTTKFSPETQDRICITDLRTRCDMDDWLAGKIDDTQFLDKIARVWAAFPLPSTGKSAYSDQKYSSSFKNSAGISVADALATLNNIKNKA